MINDYSKTLYENFNREAFYSLTVTIGDTLNSRKLRFDKSDLLEMAVSKFSNGLFEWKDQVGYDFIDSNEFKIEYKYGENMLYTAKTKQPKKTVRVKLKNSLGKNKDIIDNPADIYVLHQPDAMAIVEYNTMQDHLVSVSDGIELAIPFEKLTTVYTPTDVNLDTCTYNYKVNYQSMKYEMYGNILSNFG